MENIENKSVDHREGESVSKEIAQKVEDMGVVFEKMGRTPMTGRVFAFLLLAEPHYQSFDDIVAFLGASKSAISNALTTLQHEGSVSYITFSGDRKRYFKIDAKGWHRQLESSARNLAQLNDLLRNVYAFRKDNASGEFNEELLKLLNFQDHLSRNIDLAIDKWNKE